MAGTKVTLNVTHADNELAAFLNGVLVYDRRTENDPTFSDSVDLTPALEAGDNLLTLVGINWGAQARYEGNLTIGSFVTPFAATFPTTPNGIAWRQVFNIPY